MHKQAYLELKDKFDLLSEKTNSLKHKLSKSLSKQKSLEIDIQVQRTLLKRINRESNTEVKGWIMSEYECELEKGWVSFKVPEDPELPKQETPAKSPEKVKIEESDYDDEVRLIIKKKRVEPPPLIPEIEDAKRLLHVLFKNPKLIWPFEEPVDPVTLNIPDYPTIVKNPMDIGTIRKRIHECYYNGKVDDFVEDVRRVFTNAVTYNDPYHQIHKQAIQCSNLFEKKLDKSKLIVPPLPLGLGRNFRWKARITWRRATAEEILCWRAQKYQKVKKIARNPFKE